MSRLSPSTDRITLKIIVGFMVGFVVLSLFIIGLLGGLRWATTVQSKGGITAIGVKIYEDSACIVPFSQLNWGTLDPGSTQYIEAYVRNEGNVPVKLGLSADNWDPSNASSYIEFGWDYDNGVINAREDNVLKVTFYLRISSDVQDLTEFLFDVIIEAIKA